jgi:hypothetical protein
MLKKLVPKSNGVCVHTKLTRQRFSNQTISLQGDVNATANCVAFSNQYGVVRSLCMIQIFHILKIMFGVQFNRIKSAAYVSCWFTW